MYHMSFSSKNAIWLWTDSWLDAILWTVSSKSGSILWRDGIQWHICYFAYAWHILHGVFAHWKKRDQNGVTSNVHRGQKRKLMARKEQNIFSLMSGLKVGSGALTWGFSLLYYTGKDLFSPLGTLTFFFWLLYICEIYWNGVNGLGYSAYLYILLTDQLFNLEFQYMFVIQFGMSILKMINLGECHTECASDSVIVRAELRTSIQLP